MQKIGMQRIIRAYRTLPATPSQIRLISQNIDDEKQKSPLRRLLDDASSYSEGEQEAIDPELHWATQPYAARPKNVTPVEERVEPRDTAVLLFPGQGSQWVGMGRRLLEIPAAKELYELASSVVG